jgi:hypothetical protein
LASLEDALHVDGRATSPYAGFNEISRNIVEQNRLAHVAQAAHAYAANHRLR